VTERKLRQDLDFLDAKYRSCSIRSRPSENRHPGAEVPVYEGEGTAEDPYDLMEEAAGELASKEVIRPVQVEPMVVPSSVPKGKVRPA